jgi:hypothetical protein
MTKHDHPLLLGIKHPDACKACALYKKTDPLDLCEHCLEAYKAKVADIHNKIATLEREFHVQFVKYPKFHQNKQG